MIAGYPIIITRYRKILLYFNVIYRRSIWYIYSALDIDIYDPPRHKYLNLPNLCKIMLTG